MASFDTAESLKAEGNKALLSKDYDAISKSTPMLSTCSHLASFRSKYFPTDPMHTICPVTLQMACAMQINLLTWTPNTASS